MDKKTLSEMSGENENGGAPKLVLNQIRFNGKKGTYFYEDVKAGLIEKDGKKTYGKTDIGNEIKITFLKIRRRLYQFRKDEKALTTNEHNHIGCRVSLFGNDKVENGIASELREKYPQLRTQQIIYALYRGELVRLIIKGASLGSKSKPKDVDDFYSYISKFSGKDEHFYEYNTILSVGEENGDLGEYYVMHFTRGNKLDNLDDVSSNMEIAFNYCNEADKYYVSRMPVPEKLKSLVTNQNRPKVEEIDTIEYPEAEDEDLSVDDIPF